MMTPMSCQSALDLFGAAAGPFSFIELIGTRCTVLQVGTRPTVTAAICVKYEHRETFPEYVVSTSIVSARGWK